MNETIEVGFRGIPGKRVKKLIPWEDRLICVNNEGYEIDLKLGRVYEPVPDDVLEADEVRVIDETGEDYIYPASYFASLEVRR